MKYSNIVAALLIVLLSLGASQNASAHPRWYWRHNAHRWHSWHNDFCSPVKVESSNGSYYSREYRVHPPRRPLFSRRRCAQRRYEAEDYRYTN
jgi:hypothetical protein